MPADSLPSSPLLPTPREDEAPVSDETPTPEGVILAAWALSPQGREMEEFDLTLQHGRMKILRLATGNSKPSLPDHELVLIDVDFVNRDGVRMVIAGYRYEDRREGSEGSFGESVFDVTMWNKEGQQTETPQAICNLADDILDMAYNYKPEKISSYVWGSLMTGMNEVHTKIRKILANGCGNGV